MILFALIPVLVGIVLIFNLHGIAGAVILGISGIAADLFWQAYRNRNAAAAGTGRVHWSIYSGLLLRIATVFLFLKLGQTWLKPSDFTIFCIVLLTIPLWNLAYHYFSSLRRA